MRGFIIALAFVVMLVGLTDSACASIVIYWGDRAAWEAASPGNTDIFDDYNDITADVSLATLQDRGEYTIQAVGSPAFYSNLDGPVLSAEHVVNGTPYVQCDLYGGWEDVQLTFDNPLTQAWGADINPKSWTVGRQVTITTSADDSGSFNLPANATTFFGFVADNPFTSFTFSAPPEVVEFGWDDMATSATPEPSTLAMWSLLGGLGLTAAWWRRRRAA